jgi:hypothetical protein
MVVSLAVPCCCLWLSCRCCQKCLQSVKVHWQHGGPAKMAGVPSLLVGPGQVWQYAVVALLVSTSISCLILHESSCVGSHVGQSGQLRCLEKRAVGFDHENLSHCLWPPHLAFMVATHRDHVARWVVWWASDHFPNKIQLSSRNHVSYAGDGVKHVAHFAIAQTLFLYFCH